MCFGITDGECNDITRAPALRPVASHALVLRERGSDADRWRQRFNAAGHTLVIPGRRNRCFQPACDEHLDRVSHLAENVFARLSCASCNAAREREDTP